MNRKAPLAHGRQTSVPRMRGDEPYAGIENIVSVETVSGFFVHMSVLGSRKNEWALFATEQEMLDEVCEARIQADL